MVAMTDEIKVYDEDYPSRRLLDLIGDKWTPIIVYILGQGTKRTGSCSGTCRTCRRRC